MSTSTIGKVSFGMCNREYQFSQNYIADMLQFPYGEGVVCETPLVTDWAHKFGHFWNN